MPASTSSSRSGAVLARRAPWALLLVVVAIALAVGSRGGSAGSTEDRVRDISSTIKCPKCSGQSAATSDAPTASAIRSDIARRLQAGQSADQIRDYYATRYGEEILLTPGRSGASGLVWAVPVVAVVLAFAGIGFAFHRWQSGDPSTPSDADRDLVVSALARAHADSHGEGEGR